MEKGFAINEEILLDLMLGRIFTIEAFAKGK